jgi:hypothetical protein
MIITGEDGAVVSRMKERNKKEGGQERRKHNSKMARRKDAPHSSM